MSQDTGFVQMTNGWNLSFFLGWNNPANCVVSDNVYSTTGTTGTAENIGPVGATLPSINLPAGARISGIAAQVERKKSGSVADNGAWFINSASPFLTFDSNNVGHSAQWPTTDGFDTYGGDQDFSGLGLDQPYQHDLTWANIGFKVGAACGTFTTAFVDSIKMKFFYTMPMFMGM